ncbi:MAG: CDP-diacylglycerol--glycerol-3-phosphate 3-phosphatidyltransferase [Verrucomicrobiota bacterium]|jgi:cardiolipin synthase (CMP-forming)
MTTANKITILRILLVPLFVLLVIYYIHSGDEIYRFLAILCFASGAVSDGIDGYIARRYNQRSELGAILDPLADKLLLVAGILLLSFDNHRFSQLPLWLSVIIISRDLLLLIGLGVIHYTAGKVTVRPHFIGKMATVFQMTCVLWTLLKWEDSWLAVWVWGAGLCTGISAIIYITAGIRQLSTSPTSAPTPKQ